jgi:hypothetical protein
MLQVPLHVPPIIGADICGSEPLLDGLCDNRAAASAYPLSSSFEALERFRGQAYGNFGGQRHTEVILWYDSLRNRPGFALKLAFRCSWRSRS